MTAPAPVALVQAELATAEASLQSIIATNRDVLTDADRGFILKHLSDHIVACEVIASTLRKAVVG